jgi:hypothetical protein
MGETASPARIVFLDRDTMVARRSAPSRCRQAQHQLADAPYGRHAAHTKVFIAFLV